MFDTAYKEESDNAYCAEGYDLYNIKCAVCKYIISNKDVDDMIVASASSPLFVSIGRYRSGCTHTICNTYYNNKVTSNTEDSGVRRRSCRQ